MLTAWDAQGPKTIRQRARKMIADLQNRYEYHLEDDLQKEIDWIRNQAYKDVGMGRDTRSLDNQSQKNINF
jgi:hypothetical protein